jgi:hypothetical protein
MRKVNCILPIQIRINGSARNLDLAALGNLVAAAVESRLRFAAGAMASRSGIDSWAFQVNPPVITFNTGSLADDARTGIERTVRDAIERMTRQLIPQRANPDSIHGRRRIAKHPQMAKPTKQVVVPVITEPQNEPQHKSPVERQMAFWDALRATVLSRDTSRPEEQRRAIELLVELVDIPEAREILLEGLQIPALESIVRLEILERLLVLFDRGDRVWDLILSGVGIRNDDLAQYRFFQWLELSEAFETVEFLERKLSGKDEEMQRKAAAVVVYLLPKQFDPEAEALSDKFTALKNLAADHEIWSGGSPGAESVRQAVYSEIAVLIDLCTELIVEVESSPHEDPLLKADAVSLDAFRKTLQMKWNDVSGMDANGLEEFETRLGQVVHAALSIATRARTIRENAELLVRFIGVNAGECGEVAALLDLRHEYIVVLTGAFTDTRFTLSMLAVELRYVDSFETVTAARRKRVLDRFAAVSDVFLQARQIAPEGEPCYGMVEQLEHMKRVVSERMQSDLAGVILSETDFGLWGLKVAMFALYAAALRRASSPESSQLERLRMELAADFEENDFKSFSDRAEAIERSLDEPDAGNGHEFVPDPRIHSLLAAVAASVTFGASALARIALSGETLAVVRSAGAAGTIVLLAESAVLTDDELDGKHLVFDEPVTLSARAQAVLSNPALLHLFRVLGSSADFSPLVRWIAPLLLPVTTLNAISTLMNRLDTARWPAEISRFLQMGLANCALVDGLDTESPARRLDAQNDALFGRYRHAIESNILTEPEFESIRSQSLELNRLALTLSGTLLREGCLSDEQYRSVERYFTLTGNVARSTRFTTPEPLLVGELGERLVRPLQIPSEMQNLDRVGESNVYRFDPVNPPDFALMLSRYAVAGYGMQRYPSGLIRIIAPNGRTLFLLQPGRR